MPMCPHLWAHPNRWSIHRWAHRVTFISQALWASPIFFQFCSQNYPVRQLQSSGFPHDIACCQQGFSPLPEGVRPGHLDPPHVNDMLQEALPLQMVTHGVPSLTLHPLCSRRLLDFHGNLLLILPLLFQRHTGGGPCLDLNGIQEPLHPPHGLSLLPPMHRVEAVHKG